MFDRGIWKSTGTEYDSERKPWLSERGNYKHRAETWKDFASVELIIIDDSAPVERDDEDSEEESETEHE